MENQQLVHKRKDVVEIEEKIARLKENIEKIWNDPKAMREVEALAAS
jgi:hypothetical protein|tara:strand:- start:646 stop:786 length:141 start_codon:yes stop_codon:yes gene_type:complete